MSKASGPAADAFPCPAKTGWLTKEGGSGGSWQKRWMVLDHHYLFYYKAKDGKHPQNEICLADYDRCAHAADCKKSPYAFKLSSSQTNNEGQAYRSYMMYAESEAEMQDWIDAVLREMSPGSNSVVAPSTGSSSSPSLLEDKGSERSPTGVKFGLLLNRFKSSSTGLKKDKKEPKSLPQQTSIDKKALDVISTEVKAGPTLVHLTADRSRGQQRRPPTRMRRQLDANASAGDLFTGREIASDKAELLSNDKPEPPPKRSKPALQAKPPNIEMSPSSRPKVAIRPPLRSKEETQDSVRKPTPIKPKPIVRTPSESSVSVVETPMAKPRPAPRKRGKEKESSEPESNNKPSEPESPHKPEEVLAPIEGVPVKEQEDKMETEEDGGQVTANIDADQEFPSALKEIPKPKHDVDDIDIMPDSTSTEPKSEQSSTSETEPSETLDEENEQGKTKSLPEVEAMQTVEQHVENGKSEQNNGVSEAASDKLAEELGYVVVEHNKEQGATMSLPENQQPTKVIDNEIEELKWLENTRDDSHDVEATAEAETKEESEVTNSAEDLVEETSRVSEPSKRISQVREPHSPSNEEKPVNEAIESATSTKEVKLEADELKTLDSDQQIEQAAASKLDKLSDSPVSPQPVSTSSDKDAETPDVDLLLQSVSDPKAALHKAKEILRQSHKARIDTERALREAMLERELARKERADAEMMKKNATEILRLARAALSSIKK